MKPKKIYILGVSGSGKSTLAKTLSKQLKIKHYDLDDIYFIRKYDKIRKEENREKKLKKLIKEKKEWIIEGVFQKWVESGIKKADLIIWLKPNLNLISYRIFIRFLKRKNKESIKELIRLIKWARKYKTGGSKHYQSHKKYVRLHKGDTIILKNNKEIKRFLGELK